MALRVLRLAWAAAGIHGGAPRRVGRCLAPSLVPWFSACCARRPGLRHPVAVVDWHLSICRGCGWRRASLACLLPPRCCAAPHAVRSLSVSRLAFLLPWCLPLPGALTRGFTPRLPGTRGRRPGAVLMVVAAGAHRSGAATLARRRARLGPCPGVVPGGSLWRPSPAKCTAVVWQLWPRSLTRPLPCTVRR